MKTGNKTRQVIPRAGGNDVKERPLTLACEDSFFSSFFLSSIFPPSDDVHHRFEEEEEKKTTTSGKRALENNGRKEGNDLRDDELTGPEEKHMSCTKRMRQCRRKR